ncbi:SUPV3L1, partial [Symbiodinium microadriaticum]
EKIGPDDATHVACTVEMAPLSGYGTQGAWDVAVLDEIQFLTDAGRGWAWTRALLGTCVKDLHLCGAPEPSSLPALLRQLALSCGDSLQSTSATPKRLVPLTVEKQPVSDLSNLLPGDCLICFARAEVLESKASLEKLGLRCCCIYGSLPPEVRSEQ